MDFRGGSKGAYSKLISDDVSQFITFEILQDRLLKLLEGKVNSGDFTERGLARLIGVSQPQMHNLLKRKRRLRQALADRIMQKFEFDILCLVTDQELRNRLISKSIPDLLFAPIAKPIRKSAGRENKVKNPDKLQVS